MEAVGYLPTSPTPTPTPAVYPMEPKPGRPEAPSCFH